MASENDRKPLERRLVILAPTDRDGALTQSILEDADVPCGDAPRWSKSVRSLIKGQPQH